MARLIEPARTVARLSLCPESEQSAFSKEAREFCFHGRLDYSRVVRADGSHRGSGARLKSDIHPTIPIAAASGFAGGALG